MSIYLFLERKKKTKFTITPFTTLMFLILRYILRVGAYKKSIVSCKECKISPMKLETAALSLKAFKRVTRASLLVRPSFNSMWHSLVNFSSFSCLTENMLKHLRNWISGIFKNLYGLHHFYLYQSAFERKLVGIK